MTRRKLFVLIAAALPGAACAGPALAPAPTPAESDILSTITAEDFYTRIAYLASDELRGRDTPSEGLLQAAAYIVSEYERLGFEAAGEDGYYQWYPFPLLTLDTATAHFGAVVDGTNQMFTYGTDVFVLPVYEDGAPGGADMNHARLLYVGNTTELPSADYSGAAPIVTLPGGFSRDWSIAVNRARAAAQRAGATALVVVAAPEFESATFSRLAEQSKAVRRRIPSQGEIPVIYLTAAAADALLGRVDMSLADFPERPSSPIAIEGIDAHFAANAVNLDDARAPNVVAVLRGSDPSLRDEYVVLSAHMDHVGVGRPVDGDSIYNGADDNASGTAALLEIAEALAALPVRPARSVAFVHVSGEEHGLLGSRWFSDNPTLPLDAMVANINMDMIARNSPDSIVVIGKDYSSLGQVVNEVGARHPEIGLVVADDIWPEERFFFRSDHFNFARKEIPSLFFFSGVHPDYHQPSDEVDRLDLEKASRVARMVTQITREIANSPERPVWDPDGLAEVRALTR